MERYAILNNALISYIFGYELTLNFILVVIRKKGIIGIYGFTILYHYLQNLFIFDLFKKCLYPKNK